MLCRFSSTVLRRDKDPPASILKNHDLRRHFLNTHPAPNPSWLGSNNTAPAPSPNDTSRSICIIYDRRHFISPISKTFYIFQIEHKPGHSIQKTGTSCLQAKAFVAPISVAINPVAATGMSGVAVPIMIKSISKDQQFLC
jgi:hypothetical protein